MPDDVYFELAQASRLVYPKAVRSFLTMMLVLLVFVLFVGGGALIWYMSSSVEFTRKDVPGAVKP
jgi:hypothetical protein